MKKTAFILSIIIAFTSCKGNGKNNETAQEPTLKRYDVKSGIILYKTTTNGKVPGGTVSGEGTSSLYFKNWGALEIREEQSTQTTKVSFMGHHTEETNTSHTMNKLDNGEAFAVNFKNNTISKMRDPLMDMLKATNQDAGDVGKQMAESMGGKKVGEETYQGYNCEIWEMLGTKQWIYKGVTLKIEANLMGVSTFTEAVDVQFDINVPSSKFDLPDFNVIETENYMSNKEMDAELETVIDDIEKLKSMSFEEWKRMVTANDPEMQEMTDEELRQIYDMMKKMIK